MTDNIEVVDTVIIYEHPVAWPDVVNWAKQLEVTLEEGPYGWNAERINSKGQIEYIRIFGHHQRPKRFVTDKVVFWGSFSQEYLKTLIEEGDW